MASKKKYDKAPTYENKYEDQINDLSESILNRDPFEYDAESDPIYQQYKEQYTRNGNRAMQDTLGQVSSRTGGLASSYATAASQQAYNNYMDALSDTIPELQQLAYSMYQDEGNTMRNNLSLLQSLEQGDYSKYQDILSQWNADRNYDYTLSRDEIADQRYKEELAYNRKWQESQRDYERKLQTAQTLAAAGDFSGYKALGYTNAQIAAMQSAYNRQLASTYSRGSGSSSSGSSSSKHTVNLPKVGADMTSSIMEATLNALSAGAKAVPDFRTYDEAVSYMKKNNISPVYGNGPMTQREWQEGKRATDGMTSEFRGTYLDYLKDFVEASRKG